MSEVVAGLERGRAVAWSRLKPVFDHAISLALEAEHAADRASIESQTFVAPAYSPLVLLLSHAMPEPDTDR